LLAPVRGALAVSTDMLLEGRHFFADVDPESLGHKALAVNLSDLAAMGASPKAFTLALALPAVDEAWLTAFSRGLFGLADEYRCELVGGDTTRGPLNLCITIMGEVDPSLALRRDGARAGHDLWVSGNLGGAAWAVAHRQSRGDWARPAALASTRFEAALLALHRPQPRIALGRALLGVASAAIDLSDGLAGDLHHVLQQSSASAGQPLAARVDLTALPMHPVLRGLSPEVQYRFALAGGDDYELLFTASSEHRATLQAIADRLGLPLARIGAIEEAASSLEKTPRLRWIDACGQAVTLALQAHDHFLTPSSPG